MEVQEGEIYKSDLLTENESENENENESESESDLTTDNESDLLIEEIKTGDEFDKILINNVNKFYKLKKNMKI